MSSLFAAFSCGRDGATLFQRGFRPFFLAASVYAGIAIAVWLVWLRTGVAVPTGYVQPSLWHAHEMVFGFAGAVIAGFLLTAVPNWTGQDPPCGTPVGLLVLSWLTGRVAVSAGAFLPAPLVAVVDLSFLPGLVLVVMPMLVRSGNWRNLPFPALLATIWGGQCLAHLELTGLTSGTAAIGHRLGIAGIIMMIVIVAGRIVPNFTANWLRQNGQEGVSPPPRWQEPAVYATSVAALLLGLVPGVGGLAATVAAVAAGLHLLRLSRWRTTAVLDQPIVWILHLGYAWLVVGFAAKALGAVLPALTETAALHAFTAGTVGTMALGVMSRAALGHSGRPLVVGRLIVLGYGLISAGAALRVVGPTAFPAWSASALLVSGGLWACGFVVFAVVYWPILARPRADGRPG